MQIKNTFRESFKFTNFSLILSGVDVQITKLNYLEYLLQKYLFNFNLIILYTVIVGEVYWVINGLNTGKPFVEISLNTPCITISFLGTAKCSAIYYNNNTLKDLIKKLIQIQPKKFENNEVANVLKNKIASDSIKLLKSILYWLTILSVLVVFMFCITPLIVMLFKYFKTVEFKVVYPFQVMYFFDVYGSQWWGLIYFHQVWATIIVSNNLYACDGLFYVLCVYLDMHFKLLGVDFENAVTSSKNDTKKKLATSIRQHQELIKLVQQIEILYSKPALFNIVTSSFLICLSAFNITVAEELNIILSFITFLALSLSQISLLCYFADMLMRSSANISESIYKSQWYTADDDIKKIVFIVIIRAQRASKLTAYNFTDLSLMAFTTVLSRSWSYFALLKNR